MGEVGGGWAEGAVALGEDKAEVAADGVAEVGVGVAWGEDAEGWGEEGGVLGGP